MAYNYEYPYVDADRYNDDWLLNKMKELITEWVEMQQQFGDLNSAFNDLKSYVTNYFGNLDVQTEINNKLDAMYSAGELDTIFVKYLPGVSPFRNRGCVWFCDSWGLNGVGDVTTNHISFVASQLGFSPFVNSSVGGNGYIKAPDNRSFIQRIPEVVAQVDVNKIAYVVVEGSINDSDSTMTEISEAVQAFIKAARLAFPKAQIIVIPTPGNPTNGEIWFRCWRGVDSAARGNGARVLSNPLFFANSKNLFNSDMIHPNQAGQLAWGRLLVAQFQGQYDTVAQPIGFDTSPIAYAVQASGQRARVWINGQIPNAGKNVFTLPNISKFQFANGEFNGIAVYEYGDPGYFSYNSVAGTITIYRPESSSGQMHIYFEADLSTFHYAT